MHRLYPDSGNESPTVLAVHLLRSGCFSGLGHRFFGRCRPAMHSRSENAKWRVECTLPHLLGLIRDSSHSWGCQVRGALRTLKPNVTMRCRRPFSGILSTKSLSGPYLDHAQHNSFHLRDVGTSWQVLAFLACQSGTLFIRTNSLMDNDLRLIRPFTAPGHPSIGPASPGDLARPSPAIRS